MCPPVQLLFVRKGSQVHDVRMHLTCVIDIVRLKVPRASTVYGTFLQRVFVRITLIAQKNFWAEECGTQLERQIIDCVK